jgi:hypothetical protein
MRGKNLVLAFLVVCAVATLAYATIEPEDPVPCNPRTQGYWHRQCMGYLNVLYPVKHGPGLHPDFTFDQLHAIFNFVEYRLLMIGITETACEALDARPGSDPCQRAIKQYAALLCNISSGLLDLTCCVDFGAGITDVESALAEIEYNMVGMDPDGCKIAASRADEINTAIAVVDCVEAAN